MLMADPQRASARRGGRVDAPWLLTVELPVARAFSRGYDRVAVDGLIEECADTIDDLTAELRLAYDELAALRRQAGRAARHGRVRGRGQAPGLRGPRRRALPTR
jgi:hypothetical protein